MGRVGEHGRWIGGVLGRGREVEGCSEIHRG